MISQIREENNSQGRARIVKEKDIVLNGMIDGTKVDKKENKADNQIKAYYLIKKIRIDKPNYILEKL